MSAKTRIKKLARMARAATPAGSPSTKSPKPNAKPDAVFFSTKPEDRWNLPFEIIKGTRASIPLSQVIRDEHQPRIEFESELAKAKLLRLAKSIKNSGLQQPIMVNFFKCEKGKNVFVIDKGERRWRAHAINNMESIDCNIQPTPYSGKLSLGRIIAQYTENDQREPQSSKETIRLLLLIHDQRVKETGKTFGAMEWAVRNLAEATGRTVAWVRQFASLSRLSPHFIDLLDAKKDSEVAVLTFQVGLALSGVPQEDQKSIFKNSQQVLKERGVNAQRSFIAREARELRTKRGEKSRGKKTEDRISKAGNKLLGLVSWLADGRPTNESVEFLKKRIDSLGGIEIDELLKSLKLGLAPLLELQEAAERARLIRLGNSNLLHVSKLPEKEVPKPQAQEKASKPAIKPEQEKAPPGRSANVGLSIIPLGDDDDDTTPEVALPVPVVATTPTGTPVAKAPLPAWKRLSNLESALAERNAVEGRDVKPVTAPPKVRLVTGRGKY